jgi:hypothetical protein
LPDGKGSGPLFPNLSGKSGRKGVGAPFPNQSGDAQADRAIAARGPPFHGARAEASRRSVALGPECAEHACARNGEAGRGPARAAGGAVSTADTNEPESSRNPNEPEPVEVAQIRGPRNPNEPEPVGSCPNPGAPESERTQTELRFERTQLRRNPNEPKPVEVAQIRGPRIRTNPRPVEPS